MVTPPDIISEETSNDLMVPEGGAAKLICKAKGYPSPEIIWRREDQGKIVVRNSNTGSSKIESETTIIFVQGYPLFLIIIVHNQYSNAVSKVEGETLFLSKVTRSEMGVYLCIASNGVPPPVSKRIMLHVHCEYFNWI